jgi:DNA-binding response OmpR family regulator
MSKKILLVSQPDMSREILHEIVEENNNIVVGETSSHDEAVALFRELLPDMVILDLQIPGENGLAILAELEKINDNVLVIVCTGLNSFDNVVKSLLGGAADFITTPFSPEEVALRIDNAFTAKPNFDIEFLRQLAEKHSDVTLNLPQQIVDKLILAVSSNESSVNADTFWNDCIVPYQTEYIAKRKDLVNSLRMKRHIDNDILIELGRAEISGKEISVILGEAHLNEFPLQQLVVGKGFGFDVEITDDGNPIAQIFIDKKLVGKGSPILIKDNINETITVGNIGVIVTEVLDEHENILTSLKGSTIKLDNRRERVTSDDVPGLPEKYVKYQTRLVCTIYLGDKRYAKGWITNPASINDPKIPIEHLFRIAITEFI